MGNRGESQNIGMRFKTTQKVGQTFSKHPYIVVTSRINPLHRLVSNRAEPSGPRPGVLVNNS